MQQVTHSGFFVGNHAFDKLSNSLMALQARISLIYYRHEILNDRSIGTCVLVTVVLYHSLYELLMMGNQDEYLQLLELPIKKQSQAITEATTNINMKYNHVSKSNININKSKVVNNANIDNFYCLKQNDYHHQLYTILR